MKNGCLEILLENCNSYSEKKNVMAVMESDHQMQLNQVLISKIYRATLDKQYINFDTIPDSKGDITKYTGYQNMIEVVGLLKDLSAKGTKILCLDTVDKAIANLRQYKDSFIKGFALNNDLLMLQYNTLVYACVESISLILASYVDYIKRVDRVELVLVKGKDIRGNLTLRTLQEFNNSVKDGSFAKFCRGALNPKENLLGGGAIVAIAVLAGFVPALREIVYYFYYSKMRCSEYLGHQSMLLELNKSNLAGNSNYDAKTKKQILKKQQEYANTLSQLSDKLKVDSSLSEKKANDEIKKENRGWSLDEIKNDNNTVGDNGFSFI